jgi:hypothetical protein
MRDVAYGNRLQDSIGPVGLTYSGHKFPEMTRLIKLFGRLPDIIPS